MLTISRSCLNRHRGSPQSIFSTALLCVSCHNTTTQMDNTRSHPNDKLGFEPHPSFSMTYPLNHKTMASPIGNCSFPPSDTVVVMEITSLQ